MNEDFILLDFDKQSPDEVLRKSEEFYTMIKKRRTVREYSNDNIPEEALINIIKSAGTAPSGANKQPWKFFLIKDNEIRKQIREAAESVEEENYQSRFSESMKDDLKKLKTNSSKPFIEDAPYLIVMFKEKYQRINGKTVKNYYVNESCGIALGILISALHYSGLATVTYTANPMNFLNKILNVPDNFSPYVILPVGFPKDGLSVPDISKKEVEEIIEFF